MSGEIPYSVQNKPPMPLPRNVNIIPHQQQITKQQTMHNNQNNVYESVSFSSDDSNNQNNNNNNNLAIAKTKSLQLGNYTRYATDPNNSLNHPNNNNIAIKTKERQHGRGRTKKKKSTKSREHSLENQLSMLSSMVQNVDDAIQQRYDNGSNMENQQFSNVKHPTFENRGQSSTLLPNTNSKSYGHANRSHQQQQQQPYQPPQDMLRAEVVELRNQSHQMEKTLEWWSECTAGWRDKWAKVKNERNKARDELKRIKGGEVELVNEVTVLRQQRQLLIQENKNLKNEVVEKTREHLTSFSDTSSSSSHFNNKRDNNNQDRLKKESNGNSSRMDEDEASQKLAALQLKVEESAKTIQAERDAKLNLNKMIETLEQELSVTKQKHDEMKIAKQETLKQMARIQESHRSEIVRLNDSLEEELENRSQLEKKVQDLREEVERLQGENTSEWGRRERIETDKLQLERDNKRLKSINDELKNSMGRKCKAVVEDRDNELKQAHAQLQEFNEDLINLRRQLVRDEKLLQDRNEELSHSRRRSEQHETEVRALRSRIEDLKKQQSTTEDEVDNLQNQHRKLVRVVEEKEEELEKIQLQYDQVQTRMRHDARNKASFMRSTKSEISGSDSDD